MTEPIVILDTETANFSGAPHLLELGAVRVRDGEIVDQFESLVCPEVEIDPQASEIHGIEEDDVRAAPGAQEVLAEFTSWAGEATLAAHNAAFDARVLAYEYARWRLTPPPGAFVDSLVLARRALPDAPDHKLDTLVELLDLEDGPRHRALADAVYCWQVIEACTELAGGEEGWLAAASGGGRAPLTIASKAPAPPRMSPRLRPLERALARDEEVTLLYGDGSDHPAHITLTPRFLYRRRKQDYLEAHSRWAAGLRTYRLDRVRRVLPQTTSPS
ncbi:MAG: exonuclease domain-containing protein [Planctomycetota bacterium]|jgi:DNA polymerase III epsilon subunit family exonuclease|nr:exonuclease domain-containing protein [Planctomycetota bacterium]MDP6761931.1 exonuclease domain-containing protein [Planctomycetota bacterium]MDP6989324.1 exonuclease domain-containing protein [Planctomycetota bacterium]